MSSNLKFVFGEDNYYFTSYVYDQKHNKQEVGRFEITKLPPHSMSINVDDNYQGRGISMKLISNLLKYIISNTELSEEDPYFYIDTDASEGFWTKIGMEPTPETDEYRGYEKRILLSDLIKRVSKYSHGRKLLSSRSKSRSKSFVNDGSKSKRVTEQNPAAGRFRKSYKKNKKKKKKSKKYIKN
jgi:GNAT superfamily N-acetyltransferase